MLKKKHYSGGQIRKVTARSLPNPNVTIYTSNVAIKTRKSNASSYKDNGQAPVISATHHTHMTHLRSVIGLHTCIADRDWLMKLAPALMSRVSVSYLYSRCALNVIGTTRPYFVLFRENTQPGSSVRITTGLRVEHPLTLQ
jgi:hypothetical protein